MRARLFWRSLFIQAAWNPRDLQGAGLEWAVRTDEPEDGFPAPVDPEARHAGDTAYNGHPYLSGIAIGALRTEREQGMPTEERARFRRAIRGPLGALGDTLVWTGWVPAGLLLAAAAGLMGLPPLGAALLFLALHNTAHCTLRWWAVGAGLRHGRRVGLALQRANLVRQGVRARALALFAAGLFAGALAVQGWAALARPLPWLVVGGGALIVGAWRGLRIPGGLSAALAAGLVILVWIAGLLWSEPASARVLAAHSHETSTEERGIMTETPVQERTVRIANRMGMHARPAAEFVKLAGRFSCEIQLARDGLEVNGKSIMGVLMLAAEKGAELTIRGRGSDSADAVQALAELVEGGFGEGDGDDSELDAANDPADGPEAS